MSRPVAVVLYWPPVAIARSGGRAAFVIGDYSLASDCAEQVRQLPHGPPHVPIDDFPPVFLWLVGPVFIEGPAPSADRR